MLSFEVRKPGGESEIRKVHRDVIHIGASSGNDLVVRARGVLGRHARISVAGEELRLEVLGTSPGSGVSLNGAPVKSASLAAGDRINIGEATITLLNGPAPNPNRMSAPPSTRGREAYSAAAAQLPHNAPMGPPAAAPAQGRFPEPPRPRYEPIPERRVEEEKRPVPTFVFRTNEVWNEILLRLRGQGPLEERLQDIASYLAASTPIHSLGFLSISDASAGEAVAAIWKGSLPKPSRRFLSDVVEAGTAVDGFESGSRVRGYPIVRPGGEPVGVMMAASDVAAEHWAADFLSQLAATIGFAHAERAEAPLGERAATSGPAPAIQPPMEDPLSAIVGESLPVQNLKASLQRIASARAPILVAGEVGTGKTLVAEVLHALSSRRGRPLVRVAATASTASALEEDLLNPVGSPDRRRKPGRLFDADGGTLLIEEVGDLPPATQAVLYRLLEAREVIAPGGRVLPLDVRVICTSSRPLMRAVEDGTMRDDLYYRISALTLRLPSLKDRREDVPALLDAFAQRHGGPMADRFDVESMNAILNYLYPGNVRELENEVRRLAAHLGTGVVKLKDLDAKFSDERVELALSESDDLKEIIEKVERQVIERVMRKVRGNQSLGARLLNISRGSLIAKMKEYDIKDFRYLKRADS
jgi:DNA-binding NtrC family response regulator